MATPEQTTAYNKYLNANTEGTLINYPSAHVVSDDFIKFINTWTPKDPFSVDVSHLGNISFAEQIIYQILMSTTFHSYWSSDQKPAGYGPGNLNCFKVFRNAVFC